MSIKTEVIIAVVISFLTLGIYLAVEIKQATDLQALHQQSMDMLFQSLQ